MLWKYSFAKKQRSGFGKPQSVQNIKGGGEKT